MADVITAFTLPNQPATGTVERFALGGNGMRSPSGLYVIRNVLAVGDGTDAGVCAVEMTLDPDYCQMIQYCSMSSSQATAKVEDVKWDYVGPRLAVVQEHHIVSTFPRQQPILADTWIPPAFIIPGVDPGVVSVAMDNVAVDIMAFHANIFIYNIRAREMVPYDLLVAARGGV